MNDELNFLQTLKARSRLYPDANFCSKYSLESSKRDLQDLHTFAPLRSQNVSQKIVNIFSRMDNEFPIFVMSNFAFFSEFLMKLFLDFATKSRKVACFAFSIEFAKTKFNKLEICRKLKF